MGHMMVRNKKAFDHIGENMSEFAMNPSWGRLTKMMMTMVDNMRGEYF